MSRMAWLLVAAVALPALLVCWVGSARAEGGALASMKEIPIPPGYRDWRLVTVAHEEGDLDDIRAVLGNDLAIEAYRAGTLPFPDGAIIARLAWSHDASEENDRVFGRKQSFVAGAPKNGVQFMVKDAERYASTGGWGFAHFDEGKPAAEAVIASCFPCHAAVSDRDLVFSRYSR